MGVEVKWMFVPSSQGSHPLPIPATTSASKSLLCRHLLGPEGGASLQSPLTPHLVLPKLQTPNDAFNLVLLAQRAQRHPIYSVHTEYSSGINPNLHKDGWTTTGIPRHPSPSSHFTQYYYVVVLYVYSVHY